jgi:hypothetical protein
MSLLVQLVKMSNDSLISPLRYAKEPIVAILYVIDKKSSIVKLIDIVVCFARCAVWSFGGNFGYLYIQHFMERIVSVAFCMITSSLGM